MKYKALKRVKKDYDSVFTKPKEIQEIHIECNGVIINITEQQFSRALNKPHIDISTSKASYSMDWDNFIKLIER